MTVLLDVVITVLADELVAAVQLEVAAAEVMMELLVKVYVIQSAPVIRLNPFPMG